jgi:hypothetical protein
METSAESHSDCYSAGLGLKTHTSLFEPCVCIAVIIPSISPVLVPRASAVVVCAPIVRGSWPAAVFPAATLPCRPVPFLPTRHIVAPAAPPAIFVPMGGPVAVTMPPICRAIACPASGWHRVHAKHVAVKLATIQVCLRFCGFCSRCHVHNSIPGRQAAGFGQINSCHGAIVSEDLLEMSWLDVQSEIINMEPRII